MPAALLLRRVAGAGGAPTAALGANCYLALSGALLAAALAHALFAAEPRLRWGPDQAPPLLADPVCFWIIINTILCTLFILAKSILRLVFGELRVSERQHLKDKFWNYIFYKFIFVFGVINVQFMDEVVLWCAWFAAVGFLQLLAQLCKDRFEYLSFSSASGGRAGARLAGLLAVVLTLAVLLLVLCGGVAYYVGVYYIFAFLAADCILLSIRTSHVLFRYFIHELESKSGQEPGAATNNTEGAGNNLNNGAFALRDARTPTVYYIELSFELATLIVDFMHHLHMLLWSNIFLSMASLVICMQLRYLFQEMQRRVKKHRNYLWVLNHMEITYPMATNEELAENSDNCAICWEKLDTARKLPCAHLFHNSCLSSWLQQDTSCPTCRLRLSLWPPQPTSSAVAHNNRHPNHFFHFDGSRYVSWLPSFSVEVTHTMRPEQPATNSQMDAMARQVQQLFPHFPLSVIMQDLQSTSSIEVTIENILDGRLVLPPRYVTLEGNPQEAMAGIGNSITLHGLQGIPVIPAVLLAQNLTPNQATTTDHGTHRILQYSIPLVPAQPDHYQTNAMPRTNNVEPVAPQPETDDHIPSIRGRFSKNSQEREQNLRLRKEHLFNCARKKYLDKQANIKHNNNRSDREAGPSSSDYCALHSRAGNFKT